MEPRKYLVLVLKMEVHRALIIHLLYKKQLYEMEIDSGREHNDWSPFDERPAIRHDNRYLSLPTTPTPSRSLPDPERCN